MKTDIQNTNEKDRRCIFSIRVFWKILTLIASTVVFVAVLLWLGLYISLLIRVTVASTVEYVDAKIKQEQAVYYFNAKEILDETEKDIWSIDRYLESLEENMTLSIEEKVELRAELKKLEENSILLARNFDKYFNDLTIQGYPRSSDEITSYIYETSNFSIAINRFVRTFELSIFLMQEYRQDQIELILEDYYELIWYLDQFGLIESV